jgi:phenylpropionate dioxygenase-like ring-hydroxylating dioxygenase large terminal subunit
MSLTEARSPGITYQQLLDTDTHEVNPYFRLQSNPDFGSIDIPVDRYISQDFFDLEIERVWKRAWQMACREEHLAQVGDTYVYDIADISILVVRSAPGQIKAFYNACLHRGRLLRECSGHSGEVMRCPFHGYAWHHDGTLAEIPAAWDFPHVEPEEFSLPEVKVGTWGGWVFVNLDPNCEPLERFLGELPDHFAKWRPQDKYVSAHVGKVFRCNWKVVQEAFMEAFHVVATHPQILASIGDENTQYDIFGNFSRAISPNGTPSPHLSWTPTEQQMFDAMVDRRVDEDPFALIPEGMTARAFGAAIQRERLRPLLGDEIDTYSDAELNDSQYYTLFPNFHPWGSFNKINYRFRPYGSDVDMALMECIYLDPFTGERPTPAPYRELGPDDPWTDAIPELGNLARVFNQDGFNLPKVQKGLKFTKKPGVTLANYQESKIRHWHVILERFLAG